MEHQAAVTLSGLNWIDYTIIGILLLSVIISLIRGFVKEALSLITWIAALLIAFNFANDLGQLFAERVKSPTAEFALGFVILFLGCLIIGAIINYLISSFIHKTGLGSTDRVLGIVLGVARGVVIIAMLILVAGFTSVSKSPAWQSSLLLPHFEGAAMWLEQFIPNAVDFVNGQ